MSWDREESGSLLCEEMGEVKKQLWYFAESCGKGTNEKSAKRELLECAGVIKCYAMMATYVRTFENSNRR
jgi:hypothetical protein